MILCTPIWAVLIFVTIQTTKSYTIPNTVPPPSISRATQLPNQIYNWRSRYQIRYQVAEPISGPSKGAVLLIHGLFVNCDHWRYTLKGLAKAGYTAYAIDLLGSGYSSKPSPYDADNFQICGESRKFDGNGSNEGILKDVPLGTASGGSRIAPEVELRHPLRSLYNFFTWSDQITDFTREVIFPSLPSETEGKVTLASNSIGTISALQSVIDSTDLFNGLFIVSPNFRELHSAEVPFSKLTMPILRSIQSLLRSSGQGLFDALAKPDTVKQILMEPYAISDAVDDELVDVLLTPLLTPGASNVVFDTLSYSAGPLPEQQLGGKSFPKDVPVWICYGTDDPWTPSERVEKMGEIDTVERVVRLEGVGHCPHDEAPELVNPLLLEFLDRV